MCVCVCVCVCVCIVCVSMCMRLRVGEDECMLPRRLCSPSQMLILRGIHVVLWMPVFLVCGFLFS
jgi:hypothetical protein